MSPPASAGGTNLLTIPFVSPLRCAAGRGADGAARRPYQIPTQDAQRAACRLARTLWMCRVGHIRFAVDAPRRKSLPHDIPLWVDPRREIYFITINCRERGHQLARRKFPPACSKPSATGRRKFLWWPHIFLLMPDHLHALISFPPPASRCKPSSANGRNGRRRKSASAGSGIFLSIGCDTTKAGGRRPITFWKIPCGKNWCPPEDWPFVYFADGQRPQFSD